MRVLLNDGDGVFSQGSTLEDLTAYFEAAAGDLNNDGFIDLVLSGLDGQIPYAKIYLNDRSGLFGESGSLRTYASSIAIGDINSDSRAEIILGRPTIPLVSALGGAGAEIISVYASSCGFSGRDILTPSYSFSSPATASDRFPMYLYDMDSDGDLDLITGGSSTLAWTNNGNGHFQSYTATPFVDIAASRIAAADIDNNGETDLLLGGADGSFNRINIGLSCEELSAATIYPLYYECLSNAALGDIDGDELPDLVLGYLRGEPSSYYADMPSGLVLLNQSDSNTLPLPPAEDSLISTVNSTAVTLDWGTGSDAETADDFLTYNLRIGSAADGCDIYSGAITPGPGNMGTLLGKQMDLPQGTYYWSIQTVDGALARSAWSTEKAFSVDTEPPSGNGCAAPLNNAAGVDLNPVLQCRTAADDDGSVEYLFQLAQDDLFTQGLQQSRWQAALTWSPPSPLAENTLYYWRVNARDSYANESGFCPPFSFFTHGSTCIINASAGSGGTASPLGEVEVDYGSSQTFEITPDAGMSIADVLVDGESVGAVNLYTFDNIVIGHAIEASFEYIEYSLTVDVVGSGSVERSSAGPYHLNDIVELTAVPDADNLLFGWYGDAGGSANPLSVTIDSDKNITAVFVVSAYHINTGFTGSGIVTKGFTVTPGSTADIIITPNLEVSPDTYYRVDSVTDNGEQVTGQARPYANA